jgi:hypothetical protein
MLAYLKDRPGGKLGCKHSLFIPGCRGSFLMYAAGNNGGVE